MTVAELLGLGAALFLTLSILSYVLFGNHELFRVAVAIFIGGVAGYLGAVVTRTFLIPRLFQPLVAQHWALLLPLLFGFFLFLRGTRFSTLANLVLAMLVGVSGATLVAGAVLGTLFPQIVATWREWSGMSLHLTGGQSLAAWFLVIVVLMAFSFGRRDRWPRPLQWSLGGLQNLGRAVVVVTLGVLFARVYQAALFALIERLAFVWNAVQTFLLGL